MKHFKLLFLSAVLIALVCYACFAFVGSSSESIAEKSFEALDVTNAQDWQSEISSNKESVETELKRIDEYFGLQRYRRYRSNDPVEEIEEFTRRNNLMMWKIDPKLKNDVFTFVRVKYSNGNNPNYYGRRRGWGGSWDIDYPDSDWNFSFRLQQLTSLRVNPIPIYMELTDERLFDYPFLYMIEPGRLEFSAAEIKALRRYLANGGFMMVDDFWGEEEWENFYFQIKRVFPKLEPEELDLSHPIFNCVYELKEKPQVPAAGNWYRYGVSYERHDGKEVHYKAIKDEKDRIMVLICHNTDLGDGWEREGDSEEYFRLFSERLSYPMGINIVVYAMTH